MIANQSNIPAKNSYKTCLFLNFNSFGYPNIPNQQKPPLGLAAP